jgi:hypothetical protein
MDSKFQVEAGFVCDKDPGTFPEPRVTKIRLVCSIGMCIIWYLVMGPHVTTLYFVHVELTFF